MLEWKEPPGYIRQKGKWDDVARELRSHPGEWACLGEQSTSISKYIKRGQSVSFRPVGSFEVTCRDVVNNRAIVYIRFIGEEGSDG